MANTTADKTPISLDNLARNNERMKEYIQSEIDKIPSSTVDDALSYISENPVQNKVVTAEIDKKANKDIYDDTTINMGRDPDTTTGSKSIAFGTGVESSGIGSHAEGSRTKAIGNYAFAGGIDTTANSNVSFAYGYGLETNKRCTAAFGEYNFSDLNTLFSIGDGYDSYDDNNAYIINRHNAFEITTDGGKLHGKDIATTDMLSSSSSSITIDSELSSTSTNPVQNKVVNAALTSHTSNTSNPHNVTKSQVGLGNVPNVSTNDQTPSYTEATSLTKLTSGEKLSVAFGKISKAITDLISHIGDSVKHITSTERTNWNSAKSHADSAHAPSDAQANIIETVKVNGTALTPNSKAVDIIVPSVGNGTITITQNGTTKGTFTTNQSGNTTIDLDETRLWRRAVVGQSLSTTTNPYYKFASVSLKNSYSDASITFKVSVCYGDKTTALGILTAHIRTNGSAYWDSSEFVWEYALSGIDASKFILVHNASVNPTVAELWVKIDTGYRYYHFDVISEGTRTTSENSLWTLYNKSSAGSEAEVTSGYVQQTSTLGTLKNSINGNAATTNKLVSSSNTTITIDSSAWTTNSDGGYMYTYTLPTSMPYENFNFDVVLSTDQSAAKLQLEAWSCIIADGDITQVYSESDGVTTSVTFYAFTTKPSVALTIGIQGVS